MDDPRRHRRRRRIFAFCRGFTDMYENTKGVKALGALLRQKLEVGEQLTPEMQALLLRLARAEMERLPVPNRASA